MSYQTWVALPYLNEMKKLIEDLIHHRLDFVAKVWSSQKYTYSRYGSPDGTLFLFRWRQPTLTSTQEKWYQTTRTTYPWIMTTPSALRSFALMLQISSSHSTPQHCHSFSLDDVKERILSGYNKNTELTYKQVDNHILEGFHLLLRKHGAGGVLIL